jgi:spermidine/putrescine-binding protein
VEYEGGLLELMYGYENIPLDQALEYIRNWNPNTQTVCELRVPYWNASRKAHDYFMRTQSPECGAVYDEISKYRKYASNTKVGNLNKRLYKDKNIVNANHIIATDYKGYCLLQYGINEEGRTERILFRLYSLKEVDKRLDARKIHNLHK